MRHESLLDAPAGPDPKMGSVRSHLEDSARRGSIVSSERLEGPPLPAELAYLNAYSLELASARRDGVDGPEMIDYLSIYAWSKLTDRRLEPHEVDALLQIDAVRLAPGVTS